MHDGPEVGLGLKSSAHRVSGEFDVLKMASTGLSRFTGCLGVTGGLQIKHTV